MMEAQTGAATDESFRLLTMRPAPAGDHRGAQAFSLRSRSAGVGEDWLYSGPKGGVLGVQLGQAASEAQSERTRAKPMFTPDGKGAIIVQTSRPARSSNMRKDNT